MNRKELKQNYEALSAAKQLMYTSDKFINYLVKIDNLLDRKKPNDVTKTLNTMQDYSEQFLELNNKLPSKEILKENNLLDTIIAQQKRLDRISMNVQIKLEINYRISKKISEVMGIKLKEQITNESCYGANGETEKHLEPLVCLKEL